MTDATWQPVLIRGADLIAAWLPHAEDVTVAGANHSLALTHPGQVATALADFLERHPIAGSGQRRDRDTTLLPKGEGRGCMATAPQHVEDHGSAGRCGRCSGPARATRRTPWE